MLSGLNLSLYQSSQILTTHPTLSFRSKWDEDDIAMLHASVKKFSDDLDKLTERIKLKTNQQAKAAVRKRVQESAGMASMAGGDGPRF